MTNDERLTRFKEIREALCEGAGEYVALTAALPRVEEWLTRGSRDASLTLQAAQILLAEGGARGPTIKAAEKPLKELLPDIDKLDLQLQKCLVLACWNPKVGVTEGHRTLALAASPWWWTPRRESAAWQWIEPLLKRCNEPENWSSFPALQAVALPTFDKSGIDQRLAKAAAAATVDLAQVAALVAPFSEVTTAIQAIHAFGQKLATQIATDLPSEIRSYVDTLTAENGLLWWSHARYCRHHARPLRALPSDAGRRWWAAYELARVVPPSLIEPGCSMLVETLAGIGVSFDGVRPLKDWLSELHDVLLADKAPRLSAKFASHVERCAVGLPVSRLRLMDRSDPFDVEALTEATALDLHTPLTSWQWSSWLLRECKLELAVK